MTKAHVHLFGALAVLGASSSLSAAVLTFDITGATNGILIDETYGDRITATSDGIFSYGGAGGFTPNVEVEYNGAQSLSFWGPDFPPLTNVAYFEPDGASGYTITLTADPGFEVLLQSFDLGNFGGEVTLPSVSVQGGSIPFSLANAVLPASASATPGLSFSPNVQGQELVIAIDTTGLGGNSDNVGIDNITFSQVAVPEPGSMLLALLGGVCLLGRRRNC